MKSRISVSAFFPYPIVFGYGFILVLFLTGAQPLPEPGIPGTLCEEAEVCFRNTLYFTDSNPENTDMQLRRFYQIQERFPGSVWAKRAGIRIGLALEDHEPEHALRFWKNAGQDFPLLKDFIAFHQGYTLIALGKNIEAAELLESLIAEDPPSVLQPDMLYLAGHARYQAQQCRQALPLLRQAHATTPDSVEAPRALYAIADCADRLRLGEESRSALEELWWRYPDSPEGYLLDENDLEGQSPGLNWTKRPENYYQRAISYMKIAQFEKAISDLNSFLNSHPGSPRYEQGQFKLAMAYVRLKQYPTTERIFQKLAKRRSSWQGRATVWLARVYLRQGKGKALLDLRDSLASSLSRSDRSQIHWMCGIWFEDQGKYNLSIQSYEQAAKTGGSAVTKAEAFWRLGWLRYQQGQFKEANAAFQTMNARVIHPKRHQQAQYWQARTFDHLGDTAQAQALYRRLAVDFPLTYYGQSARQHLSSDEAGIFLTETIPGIPAMKSDGQRSYRDNVHFQKSQEFSQLGLTMESSRELLQAVENFRSDPPSLSRLAIHLMDAEAYDSALEVARRYFREEIERGRLSKSSRLWQVAFPRGYLGNIRAYAEPIVDPYLVAGIIREESLYDPRALSPVGAIGLMQLMPETANRVADQLGISPVETEDLFQGDTNIRLGVHYVAKLLEKYEGNLVYAVAAYNAGPKAVARWKTKFGQRDPDEFLELIPYKETRRYVKRVLTSYRAYHLLGSTTCSSSSLDMSC